MDCQHGWSQVALTRQLNRYRIDQVDQKHDLPRRTAIKKVNEHTYHHKIEAD